MKRPWYSLSASTRTYLYHCYNIIVRAIVTAVSVAALLGLSVVLNWVVHKSLEQVNVSKQVQDTLSVIFVSIMVAIAIGVAIINVSDVWNLVQANFRSASQDDGGVEDG